MSSAARNASNNALVAKLKRLTNKKQLLFGELTQKLNSIQAEYSSLEVVYETTLEQIDSLKDRSRVANLELRGHAGDLLQLQRKAALLKERQSNHKPDLQGTLEDIVKDEITAVLNDFDAIEQSLLVKRIRGRTEKQKEEGNKNTITVRVQNAIALEKSEHQFGHLVKDTSHRTRDFFITYDYTFGQLTEEARRYWGEPTQSGGFSKIYSIADESGAFYLRSETVMDAIQGVQSSSDFRLFLLEIYHIPIQKLLTFDVDFKEIHVTELEKKLNQITLQKKMVRDAQKNLFTLDEVMSSKEIVINDLLIFLFFAAIYLLSSVTRRAQTDHYGTYWHVNTVLGSQTDFNTVHSLEAWWDWLEGPLAMSLNRGREKKIVGLYDYVVGGIRIRQMRVESNCNGALEPTIVGKSVRGNPQMQFKDYFGVYDRFLCFDATPYGPINSLSVPEGTKWTSKVAGIIVVRDDKKNFPAGSSPADIAMWRAFVYRPDPKFTSSTLKSYTDPEYFDTDVFLGKELEYGGGGFAIDIPVGNMSNFLRIVRNLKDNKWTDRQTRSILLTLNLYNANTNVFAPVQFILEKDMAGLVTTLLRVNTLRLDFYTSTAEKFHALYDLILMVCMFYFLKVQRLYYFVTYRRVEKATGELANYQNKICGVCRVWFFSSRTLLEVLLYAAYISSNTLRLILYFEEKRLFDFSIGIYRDLTRMVHRYNASFVIDGLAFLLMSIKLFRYVKLNARMNVIVVMFQSGRFILSGYVIIFIVMMLAFGLFAHNLFGRQLTEFSEILLSMRTLFFILFGKFNFERINEVDPVMGPIFFLLFEVIVYFVLLNMFLAIVNYLYLQTSKIYNQHINSYKSYEVSSLWDIWASIFIPWLGEHHHTKLVRQERG
jgi:hypothetical protein